MQYSAITSFLDQDKSLIKIIFPNNEERSKAKQFNFVG